MTMFCIIDVTTPCEVENCATCNADKAFLCEACDSGYKLHEDKLKCCKYTYTTYMV